MLPNLFSRPHDAHKSSVFGLCAHCKDNIKRGRTCYEFNGSLYCSKECIVDELTHEMKIIEVKK